MLDKDDVARIVAEDFNCAMDLYSRGTISAAEAVVLGSNILSIYFRNTNFENPKFRIDDFSDAIRESLPKQFKTMDQEFFRGCLFEGMIRFGAEPKRTCLFLCDYLLTSENTIKSAHMTFTNFYYERDCDRNQSNEIFVEECCHWITSYISKLERKLPKASDYPEAHKSFNKFYVSCKSELEKKKTQGTVAYRQLPYAIYPRQLESIEVADLDVKESN